MDSLNNSGIFTEKNKIRSRIKSNRIYEHIRKRKDKLLKKAPISFTLFRLFLAIILFFIILSGRQKISVFLFSLTAFISFFEVFVQKKESSQIRSIISLLADKFLVNLSAVALVIIGMFPFWVMAVFLARDSLTIIAGYYLLYKDSRREFKATLIGKIMLFFQIISIVPAILGQIDMIFVWIAVALTVISALELFYQSEFRPTRSADLSEFKMSKLLKVSDAFTLANAIFGLSAIFFVINESYNMAVASLFSAVIADYIDGKLARKLSQQNNFGKELDSLADTISFGVAPAILGFSLIQTPLAMASFAIFLFCGILRLARYNIMDMQNGFAGMPITLNGVIIPLFYLFGTYYNMPVKFYPYLYIVLAILMVSSVRFKKI
ncbi:CDP-diacylglycerol--serine O-phosphatidyltransferase [Candidatus Woesearchaeota archaeon]|nr:CDP-diacylglycerol--serine O-phosphatidyltransferase [Candidatus Woesearchaeota archaeon]